LFCTTAGPTSRHAATAPARSAPRSAGAALAIGVLMRDDDMKVRIQAAWALDKIGDDAVREAAAYLSGSPTRGRHRCAGARGAQGPRAERAAQGLETPTIATRVGSSG